MNICGFCHNFRVFHILSEEIFLYKPFGMKIYSYNVNGLRSAISKGFMEWLKSAGPDVLCLQEIKATADQIDTSALEKLGYRHFWNPAEKKGYSGVAVFTRLEPRQVVYGMGIRAYDTEGRVLQLDMENFTLLCTYFPSGSAGDERQAFKMKFLEDYLMYTKELRKTRPNLIVSGDYNICHKPIDINHPSKHTKMSGFLPEEREWLDRFVESGFIDSFRRFHAEGEQYSWWSYRANSREKNLGWRIDYHMVSESLAPRLLNAGIAREIMYSDHCPVWMELV